MPANIHAVFFDFGGVLLRTEDPAPRQKLAEKYGMTSNELEKLVFLSETSIQASTGKIRTSDHWLAVARTLQAGRDQIEEIRRQFYGGDQLDFELVDYLRQKRGSVKTGLLSNAWDDLRHVLVDKMQIADAFDALIISAEEGVMKPDRRIYELAAQRLQIPLQQAVFVDDVLENVEGARAAGMAGIQFTNTRQVLQSLDGLLAER